MVTTAARRPSLLFGSLVVLLCYLGARTAYERLTGLLAASGTGAGTAAVLPLPVYLLLVVAGVWLTAGWLGLRPDVRALLQVTPASRRHVLIGLAAAALLVGVTYGVDLAAGWAGLARASLGGHLVTQLGAYAVLYAVIAFNEELVFRGALVDLVGRASSLRVGVLASSALFAAVHALDSATWPRLAGLLLLGLLLALLRLRSRSLWPAISAHLFVHFLSYALVVGLLPAAIVLRGPLWLTGTPDQLDAGAVMIAVSAVAVAILAVERRIAASHSLPA